MEIKLSEKTLKTLLNIKEDASLSDIEVTYDGEFWVFDITEIPLP